MAFKPEIREKEIGGVVYKAQFSGVSMLYRMNDECDGKLQKQAEFIFKHVIVEPRIDDIDDYFGTDVELQNEVIEFAGKVMRADAEYFPDKKKGTVKK